MKHYSIYALIDDKGKIFYIGCSINVKNRIKYHIYKSFDSIRSPLYEKIKNQKHTVNYKIIDEITTEYEYVSRCIESFWIIIYKAKRIKLLNKTIPVPRISKILPYANCRKNLVTNRVYKL